MLPITHALLGEHAVFYKQFLFLEKMAETENNLEPLVAAAKPISDSLISHAHLEDEILIPDLERLLGHSGPPTVVKMDHQDIHAGLNDLLASSSLSEFRDRLPQILGIIRNHFAMEEEALFVMAREMLSPEQCVAMGERWAEARGVMVR